MASRPNWFGAGFWIGVGTGEGVGAEGSSVRVGTVEGADAGAGDSLGVGPQPIIPGTKTISARTSRNSLPTTSSFYILGYFDVTFLYS